MVYKCYIDGKQVDGLEGDMNVVNPGTEELVGTVSLINVKQAESALVAAQKGHEYWSSLTLEERVVWINKLADAIKAKETSIVQVLMEETGKIKSGAQEDYQMLLDCLDFFPKEAAKFEAEVIETPGASHENIITREPVGVVVAYLAWNFPLLNLGYKLGPVLASGCSCVIKPAETTPLATLMIGKILEEIKFPRGVVNIVLGDVARMAHAMNTSPIPQMVTLIGSTYTGKRVVHESLTTIKKFSLELGGNAPAIVLKDYDEKLAAKTLTEFKFANSGQVCVSPNRIFVHEDQYDAFIETAGQVASKIKPGWGNEEGAGIGPMITAGSRARILDIIEDAVEKGARIIYGGKIPADKDKGYYMEPTVLADVTTDMRCYQEEIFGPIMPIIKYNDLLDLVAAANDTEYGLTSYLFTNDEREVTRFAKGIRSGTLCVNAPMYSVELPHGGVKNSGIGKDCSKYSLEEYYYIKRLSILR